MTYTNAQVLDSVKRCSDWIKKNKKNPLTVRVNKDVLPINDWKKLPQLVEAKTRLDKWIKEHKGTFPNYVTILNYNFMKAEYKILWGMVEQSSKTTTTPSKSTTRFVSSPHDLTVGCGKLGQINGSNCGPHALKKALEKFGINVSEKDLASVAGTTGAGTGHSGLETALAWVSKTKKVKFNHTWYNFSSLGKTQKERFKKWGELIADPNTAVVIHEGYHNGGTGTSGKSFGHYAFVRIINLATGYIQELNSLGSKCGGVCYCGFLNDRKFSVQEQYFKEISQKSIWVIKKI